MNCLIMLVFSFNVLKVWFIFLCCKIVLRFWFGIRLFKLLRFGINWSNLFFWLVFRLFWVCVSRVVMLFFVCCGERGNWLVNWVNNFWVVLDWERVLLINLVRLFEFKDLRLGKVRVDVLVSVEISKVVKW